MKTAIISILLITVVHQVRSQDISGEWISKFDFGGKMVEDELIITSNGTTLEGTWGFIRYSPERDRMITYRDSMYCKELETNVYECKMHSTTQYLKYNYDGDTGIENIQILDTELNPLNMPGTAIVFYRKD